MNCHSAVIQGYGGVQHVVICKHAQSLPFTGTDLWLMVTVGAALLAVGLICRFVGRR